jgi:hypothetical protein
VPKNATLYVVRLMKNNIDLPSNQNCWLGCAKPCRFCEPFLLKNNIQRVKYTDIQDGINVLCEMRIKK